jgi:hypothetical protein
LQVYRLGDEARNANEYLGSSGIDMEKSV